MRPSLPVEGISLILGNERVMADPRGVEKPRDDEKTERLAEKFPGIFPASVVTRSIKAKKEAIKERRKLVSQVHFLITLMVSLRRGIRKRQRKP